jgi:hypothetical protein
MKDRRETAKDARIAKVPDGGATGLTTGTQRHKENSVLSFGVRQGHDRIVGQYGSCPEPTQTVNDRR